uniref:RNA-directed DNA polymerase, eukaryota n=1 Tax=Tanacetum cinerariifolium TaxID=118510 RepID=A0A6L2NV09_TANCI|nr:RNA-directed DNA polymerase, eukaryota [Tanacetum cinerariifolium]
MVLILNSGRVMAEMDKTGLGNFTVSSARSIIDEYLLPSANTSTRWSSFAPIAVNILAWHLAINKIATRVNLYNKGIEVSSILCGVCGHASESAFSTSGRVLSIRRTRLTPAFLEMCICLKDHLDAKERKQDKCPLETPLDFEEDVFDDGVQRNKAIPLSDEELH